MAYGGRPECRETRESLRGEGCHVPHNGEKPVVLRWSCWKCHLQPFMQPFFPNLLFPNFQTKQLRPAARTQGSQGGRTTELTTGLPAGASRETSVTAVNK